MINLYRPDSRNEPLNVNDGVGVESANVFSPPSRKQNRLLGAGVTGGVGGAVTTRILAPILDQVLELFQQRRNVQPLYVLVLGAPL